MPALLAALALHSLVYEAPSLEDPGDISCQGWCDKIVHCQNKQCSSCSMCGKTVACRPTRKDDLHHESCESWCKAEQMGPHCNTCACRRCDFCSSLVKGGVEDFTPIKCAPASKDDLPYEACSKWCRPEESGVHCGRCACKQCEFCDAVSSAAVPSIGLATIGNKCKPLTRDDASVESCRSYCKSGLVASHCSRCDCKGCSFCSAAELEKCSPFDKADSNVQGCEPFCNPARAKDNCLVCRCKKCDFCRTSFASEKEKPRVALPSPPEVQCATIAQSGSWAGGLIAQVRMEVWEVGGVVRLVYEPGVELDVAKTSGAELQPALSSASVLTFVLGSEEKALRVSNNHRAFEVPSNLIYTSPRTVLLDPIGFVSSTSLPVAPRLPAYRHVQAERMRHCPWLQHFSCLAQMSTCTLTVHKHNFQNKCAATTTKTRTAPPPPPPILHATSCSCPCRLRGAHGVCLS